MSTVDWTSKGLWLPDLRQSDEEFVAAGHALFDGPFSWPVMVARRPAIEANIATMAAYCARHDVDFAPHGKTTMAPGLFTAQLAAGAWAITVATANQALAARRFGVPRVLLANELLDPLVLRWAADEVAAGWDFLCYVDSLAGVAVLRSALAGRGPQAPLRVLVELGFPGGRTGARTVAGAAAVARAASTVDGVEVAGVAAFEGTLTDPATVAAFIGKLVAAAHQVPAPTAGPLIVSAGGSAFFDTVVEVLGPPAREHGWRVVLRSGAVVSHDDDFYATRTPFRRVPHDGALTAALEVWAQVLSAPEPGLAILGAGKRDLAFDLGLPVPIEVRAADGALRPLTGSTVDTLNDQHAYLRLANGTTVVPGELVRLGISHPCTAFDKWRVIPVVDDEHRVVDLLHTYF